MSEDLKCKQMLEECQTENYRYCQLCENFELKQKSIQWTHKILQPCVKDHCDKMLFFSQPVSEGNLSWILMSLSWNRCNNTGVLSSRNDNVLPQNVINVYDHSSDWSNFTVKDLIYFSKWHIVHILSRPPR